MACAGTHSSSFTGCEYNRVSRCTIAHINSPIESPTTRGAGGLDFSAFLTLVVPQSQPSVLNYNFIQIKYFYRLKAEGSRQKFDPQITKIIRRLRRLSQIKFINNKLKAEGSRRSTDYKNYPQISQIIAD
jgi:hypothetical protein